MKHRVLGTAFLFFSTFAMSLTSICIAGDLDQTLKRGQIEMQNAIASLAPRPSFDTRPVEFSVGGIEYRMPRNYLVTMDNWAGGLQDLVTVRVNLPDLGPITPATHECFSRAALRGTPGCDPLSFTINAPGGVSSDEAFANITQSFRNKIPIQGPSGYEKYEIGPDNARVETYRKADGGRTLLYLCQIFNNGERAGMCYPIGDRLADGAVLQFYFPLRLLADVEKIDDDLRRFVGNCTVHTGDSK